MTARQAHDDRPLCVDLDGTLTKCDTLHESIAALIFQNPLNAARICIWALKGKAYLKAEVCRRAHLRVDSLPYSEPVVEYVRQEKQKGRRIVLVTGAFESLARSVATHIQLFDEIVASTAQINLTGRAKKEELVRRFGPKGFDYIGNSRVDIYVWEHARKVLVGGATRGVLRNIAARRWSALVLGRSDKSVSAALRALRPHQWSKNALIFLPLLVSHKFVELGAIWHGLLAFCAFCFAASGIYLLNDLADVSNDRLHATKRLRAIAAGQMSILVAGALFMCLVMLSFGIGSQLPATFVMALGAYFLTSVAYSFFLKRVVLVDVVTLGMLYTLRVVAGAFAIGVAPSFWLLAFSLFLFLSLATLKRFAELRTHTEDGVEVPGRGYRGADTQLISQVGVSSGNVSVLVLALYINSADVKAAYSMPSILWLLVPLMYSVINHLWFEAARGKVSQDPVLYALKDAWSVVGAAVAVLIVVIAWLGEEIQRWFT